MKTNNILLIGGIALLFIAFKLNKKKKQTIEAEKAFKDSQDENVYDSNGKLVKCVNAPCYDVDPSSYSQQYMENKFLTGSLIK